MQLQALFFLILMIIIFPVIILFSDHNVFFIIVGAVLFIGSVLNLISLGRKEPEDGEPSDDLIKNFEDTVGINMQKFNNGLKVAKILVNILFLIYCLFFTKILILKLMISILVFKYTVDVKLSISKKPVLLLKYGKVQRTLSLFTSLSMAIIIIAACLSKFYYI